MRFLLRHYHTLSHWPLQTYSSAIIFSPESSVLKGENIHKVPVWLRRAPRMEDSWTPMIQALAGHLKAVEIITISPDGKHIASGSVDGIIKLWDSVTGSLQQTLSGHQEHITAMAFLPDSKLIMSGAYEGSVKLWDTTTGDRQVWFHLDGPDDRYNDGPLSPNALAFSADCRQIAATGYHYDKKVIMLFDAATGDFQRILPDQRDRVSAMVFSPDAMQLVSGYHDGTVRLWDTTTGDLLKTLVGPENMIQTVAFSPDGKQILTTSNNAIDLWNAATGYPRKQLAYRYARSAAFSPDSKQIAACFTDGMIFWDTAGNTQKTLACHLDTVTSMAFSSNGKQIVTGSNDATIRRWDITIDATQNVVGHSEMISMVAISPDGKVIASGSADKTIMLWDAATGDLQQTLAGHRWTIQTVVFSPDNKQIASCSSEAVNLWDAATGDLQNSLDNNGLYITVAFSPDSKLIATGHKYGQIRLWNPATGDFKKTLAGHIPKSRPAVDRRAFTLIFSPDGKLIASAFNDGTIKLWDSKTGDLQKTLECNPKSIITAVSVAHATDGIITMAFSTDSQQIAAVCGIQTIKVWNIKESLKASKFQGRAVGSLIKSSRPWKEIKTSEQLYNLKFAAGNRHLETAIGPIPLGSTAEEEAEEELPVRSDSDSLQNLYVKVEWVYYGNMPLLRLLPDFKVCSWDTHGDLVVVGFSNRLVLRFYIDRRSLHESWEHFNSEGNRLTADQQPD
jgi:WD40 repeat protein